MSFKYAPVQYVEDTSECLFYHSVTLPQIGEIKGDWDLRSCMQNYTGNYNFSGKRVLDIGTAGGVLTFFAEQQGAAEVISFDQSEDAPTNSLPEWGSNTDYVPKQKRAYWLAHRLLNSKANAFYGNIYSLPEELGQFDVAIVGSILLHLESPFSALRSISKLAKTIIVTETIRPEAHQQHLEFRPLFHLRSQDYAVWWSIPPVTINRMLQSLGYSTSPENRFSASSHLYGTIQLYSIVGEK